MRNEAEVMQVIDRYSDMVRRICFVYTKNLHDSEDIFQDVFLKYALHKPAFESDKHEKAWLIRVSINRCKDLLRRAWRKDKPLDEVYELPAATDTRQKEVLEAVAGLPEKYRSVIYLHYIEGYTAPEISGILGKNQNTIYTWLTRAKQELKNSLGGELDA